MAEDVRVQETVEQEETKGQAAEADKKEDGSEPITLESVMAELAKAKAESAKNKAALDKALHSNGELTKQLRAKMTASEQEEEAKRLAEEAQANRIKELEDFQRRTNAKERYLQLGMAVDLAKEAAEAEVAGDMDALTSVYKRYNEASMKAFKDEWMKTRPVPESGRGENADKEDPFLAGFKMGY